MLDGAKSYMDKLLATRNQEMSKDHTDRQLNESEMRELFGGIGNSEKLSRELQTAYQLISAVYSAKARQYMGIE